MTRFVPFAAPRAGSMIAQAGFGLGVIVGLMAGGGHSPAAAQSTPGQMATPWVKDLHSAIGLIGGGSEAGVLLGGIAIRLDPGWKTYWRTPGDSGVPPRFDFAASDNVADVTVLWPVPKQFPDGAGGISLGYQSEVVLPLRIVAREPDRPVTLRAQIDYAVCEKLCLPVQAKAELAFPQIPATADPRLTAALARVPKHAAISATDPLGVRAVKRNGATVTVDVAAPPGDAVELLVEGPTPEWALPVPKLVETTPAGLRRFAFELDGLPSGARADGAVLKLTLADADHALDYDVTLE
jgi:DsbC/DsbD-like thiol-disulfide interchange protein